MRFFNEFLINTAVCEIIVKGAKQNVELIQSIIIFGK